MKPISKYLMFGSAMFVLGIFSSCQYKMDKDKLNEICKSHCQKDDPLPEPQIFVLSNKAVAIDRSGNSQILEVPYSKILVETNDGDLVTPQNTVYGRPREGDGFMPNKSQGLNPRCFSKVDYSVPSLDDISLMESDVTITVINFDDTGRLESYNLVDSNGTLPLKVRDILSGGNNGNYKNVQDYLSGNTAELELSDLSYSDVIGSGSMIEVRNPTTFPLPGEKTPFYKKFDVGSGPDLKGHVFFYVLADSNLKFNRDVFALLPAAPDAENAMGKLYSPFIQYPVVPAQPDQDRVTPPNPIEVLTVHFKRGGTMTEGVDIDPATGEMDCRYPYDLGVIAKGQAGYLPDTPLLIDPEVDPRGPIGN